MLSFEHSADYGNDLLKLSGRILHGRIGLRDGGWLGLRMNRYCLGSGSGRTTGTVMTVVVMSSCSDSSPAEGECLVERDGNQHQGDT